MTKLKGLFHWPGFAAAMAVCAIGGFVTWKWTAAGFWAGFILTAIGMAVNGWIATIEDEEPGGFHNPLPKEEDRDEGP